MCVGCCSQYTDYREKREQDRQKYTSTKPETSSEGYRVQEGTEPDLCTPELEQMNRAKRVKFNHSEATRPVEHTQQPKDVQERLSTSRSSFSPLVHIHATDPRPYTSYHLYTSWNYPGTTHMHAHTHTHTHAHTHTQTHTHSY